MRIWGEENIAAGWGLGELGGIAAGWGGLVSSRSCSSTLLGAWGKRIRDASRGGEESPAQDSEKSLSVVFSTRAHTHPPRPDFPARAFLVSVTQQAKFPTHSLWTLEFFFFLFPENVARGGSGGVLSGGSDWRPGGEKKN